MWQDNVVESFKCFRKGELQCVVAGEDVGKSVFDQQYVNANPIVTVDYKNHPLYTTNDYYAKFVGIFKAEVLIYNSNTGTMRVRLYDGDGKLVALNHDTHADYVVEPYIVFKSR